MSASRVGKAAEKRVRQRLQDDGYTIITSQLSRGAADFMAGKPGQVLAVQVKRNLRSGGGVGVTEWNALVDHAEAFNAVPVIAFAPSIAGIRFYRVLARKTGARGVPQPWTEFVLDEIAATVGGGT